MRKIITPKEQMVVDKYLGNPPYKKHSLAEIGVELGVTRERVRQIRNRALYLLCKHSQEEGHGIR
jgi:DNA-directed RNA polymerase sigma subunit (sigma70/sigma32)